MTEIFLEVDPYELFEKFYSIPNKVISSLRKKVNINSLRSVETGCMVCKNHIPKENLVIQIPIDYDHREGKFILENPLSIGACSFECIKTYVLKNFKKYNTTQVLTLISLMKLKILGDNFMT